MLQPEPCVSRSEFMPAHKSIRVRQPGVLNADSLQTPRTGDVESPLSIQPRVTLELAELCICEAKPKPRSGPERTLDVFVCQNRG